jgi:hypothetical protein
MTKPDPGIPEVILEARLKLVLEGLEAAHREAQHLLDMIQRHYGGDPDGDTSRK